MAHIDTHTDISLMSDLPYRSFISISDEILSLWPPPLLTPPDGSAPPRCSRERARDLVVEDGGEADVVRMLSMDVSCASCMYLSNMEHCRTFDFIFHFSVPPMVRSFNTLAHSLWCIHSTDPIHHQWSSVVIATTGMLHAFACAVSFVSRSPPEGAGVVGASSTTHCTGSRHVIHPIEYRFSTRTQPCILAQVRMLSSGRLGWAGGGGRAGQAGRGSRLK